MLYFMQLTEQVRHQMQATLQEVYGVNLDNPWNHRVTDSWDKAQKLVRIVFNDMQFWFLSVEHKRSEKQSFFVWASDVWQFLIVTVMLTFKVALGTYLYYRRAFYICKNSRLVDTCCPEAWPQPQSKNKATVFHRSSVIFDLYYRVDCTLMEFGV